MSDNGWHKYANAHFGITEMRLVQTNGCCVNVLTCNVLFLLYLLYLSLLICLLSLFVHLLLSIFVPTFSPLLLM